MVRNDFQTNTNIVLKLPPTINTIELELREAITLESVANECHLQTFAINHRWSNRQERCYSVICTQQEVERFCYSSWRTGNLQLSERHEDIFRGNGSDNKPCSDNRWPASRDWQSQTSFRDSKFQGRWDRRGH